MMKNTTHKNKIIRKLAAWKYGTYMNGTMSADVSVDGEMRPYIVGAALGLGINTERLVTAVDKEFKKILKENHR